MVQDNRYSRQAPAAMQARDAVFDVEKFRTANRIHVEHGSLFPSQFLTVHPRELAPQNEAKLREKMFRVYDQDAPSFFGYQPRAHISLQLGALVPLSTASKKASLQKQLMELSKDIDSGQDTNYAKAAQDRAAPFQGLIRQITEEPDKDPAAYERLQNSLMMYLVLDEALSQRGYMKEPAAYIRRLGHPENMLADLERKLGISPREVMDVAHSGGPLAVGQALGLDTSYLQQVHDVVALATHRHFSDNIIQHWQIGRQLPGMQNASVQQQVEAGVGPRISFKINQMRAQVGKHYDVPQDIQQTEQMIVGALRLLPPPLAEALYELGTEFAYTPEMTVDTIAPGARAHGFHRKLSKSPGDVDGVYHIFVSGKEDPEAFLRVLVHEAHHLLFPKRFTMQDQRRVDGLAKYDAQRLTQLKELMDAWLVGNDEQKDAIRWKINKDMGLNGLSLDDAIGKNGDMVGFYNMVQHAYERLNIDSPFYSKVSYNTPQDKFYEIISRYSELKFVRLREQPELLQFLAPGISEAYDLHYLPHIEEELHAIKQNKPGAGAAVSTMPPNEANTTGQIGVAAQVEAHNMHAVPNTKIAAQTIEHETAPLLPAQRQAMANMDKADSFTAALEQQQQNNAGEQRYM